MLIANLLIDEHLTLVRLGRFGFQLAEIPMMEEEEEEEEVMMVVEEEDFMDYQRRLRNSGRISRLPDEILGHILSFLPTKEAVKTSILSKRWKDSFKLVSNFNFILDDKVRQHKKESTVHAIKSFMTSVNRALFLHNRTIIETFCLKCGEGIDPSSVYGWICAVLCHGIQHLDLFISTPELFTLPSALFTCKTLVTLKLKMKLTLYVPNDICLPMLKTLHLKSIEFLDDDSVDRLFSSCISLEEMVIEECKMDRLHDFKILNPLLKRLTIVADFNWDHSLDLLVIDAPNLVYFKYDDFAFDYSLLNLHSLVKADVNVQMVDLDEHYIQSAATEFFKGIENVQSLDLSLNALQVLLFYDLSQLLFNLVQLKIHCEDIEEDIVNVQYNGLLKHLPPSLEKLAFHEEIFNLSDLPTEVPTFLDFNLKAIEITDSHADQNSIKKAKYFLKNTAYLEKLTMITQPGISEEQKLKMAEELMASPRKSNQCCILIV